MSADIGGYHRLRVDKYIDSFCGWIPLIEMIKYAGNERNQAFLTFLFKTGGRASEALMLTPSNFTVKDPLLIVSNMRLLKHFKKVGIKERYQTESGEWVTRWNTETVTATRKPFPIPLKEPLTEEMVNYLESGIGGYLFPSPYTNKPLTRFWAYQLIRKVSDDLPKKLFRQLGLDRPFLDDKGNVIENQIHLWLHWTRSQRASQLSSEYDFKESELMEFFGWLDYPTALHYSHLGYEKLASKMLVQKAPML
jgi:hypothetical protein